MGMFEMTPDQVVEWRQKYRDLVAPHVNGEEVLSAAGFRSGGAAATTVASKAQLGGLVYAGIKLFNKKKAGGLPPAEGEKATLVGVGVKDDPLSQELIDVLSGTAPVSA